MEGRGRFLKDEHDFLSPHGKGELRSFQIYSLKRFWGKQSGIAVGMATNDSTEVNIGESATRDEN